jgi:hypothetical protein
VNPRDGRWTTADLERFIDGELDPTPRESLADAIRSDPSLRTAVGQIRRIDTLVRRTLAAPAANRTQRPALGRRIALAGPVAAAAVLLIAVWATVRPVARPAAPERNGDTVSATAASTYEPIRVVLTLPVRPGPAMRTTQPVHDDKPPRADLAPEIASAASPALDELLAKGDIDAAVSLLAVAPRNERIAGYARLGELLLSARNAERVLDTLSPADQLDVCATWAAEPALRFVAFRRLEKLAGSPELANALAGVVNTLARDDVMRPWLMSYRLMGREGRP